MKKSFYGTNKHGPYFEGWYFKCQTQEGKAIALIPALHINDRGQRSSSIQVISSVGAWWLEYPENEFSADQERLYIDIGGNRFCAEGLSLNIEQESIFLNGDLDFGPFQDLRSDIMGPFRFLENMECSHGVISMTHSLRGQITLNGDVFDFNDGVGYIETDRGRSFPNTYLWTQCAWEEGSLMLSIAVIPLAKIRFTGCICAIIHNGIEYRVATYRGAKVERWDDRTAVIQQGRYRLEVELLETQPHPLRAPASGTMVRTIHESLCAKLRYRFWIGEKLLFDHTDHCGSFEFAKY